MLIKLMEVSACLPERQPLSLSQTASKAINCPGHWTSIDVTASRRNQLGDGEGGSFSFVLPDLIRECRRNKKGKGGSCPASRRTIEASHIQDWQDLL